MTDQTAPTRVAIETRMAIEELVAEHAWLIDHGRAGELPDLYTPNGRLLGVGDPLEGRAAITAWRARRAAMRGRTSRHVCGNPRLAPEYVTRDLFEQLMHDEEEHIDFLETQIELVARIGLELYAQRHIGELHGD